MSNESTPTFEEVVEQYSGFVYNVALRMMSDPTEAEDVTQEAFIDAYRAWDRFRGESKVTTWLYRITVNRSLMKLRKEKRARQLTQTGLEDTDAVSQLEGPEQAAISAELRDKLSEGVDLLPKDMKAAVVMRDIQGMSNEEAADILDISVSALKARLHRGLILLRKFLLHYGQGLARG